MTLFFSVYIIVRHYYLVVCMNYKLGLYDRFDFRLCFVVEFTRHFYFALGSEVLR